MGAKARVTRNRAELTGGALFGAPPTTLHAPSNVQLPSAGGRRRVIKRHVRLVQRRAYIASRKRVSAPLAFNY